MKIIINQSKSLSLILPALIILGLASCKKYNSTGFTPGSGSPTIDSVTTLSKTVTSSDSVTITAYDTSGNISTTVNPAGSQVVAFDSLTKTGDKGQIYVIHGKNLGSATTVSFNGTSVYFNPALSSDNTIIVTIPLNVPTVGAAANDTLAVTTLHGTAYYSFSVNTPPPTIAAVSDYDFWSGSQITFTGIGFASVTAVGLTGSTATCTIVSQTDDQLVLQFPSVAVNRCNLVFSYSSSGATLTETTSQEFNDLDNAVTIFAMNNFQNGWQDDSWQAPSGLSTDATHSSPGTSSAEATYPSGNWAKEGWAYWSGFAYDASYKYFTFWVKGGSGDQNLVIVGDQIPGGWQNTAAPAIQQVPVPANVWTFYKIPLGTGANQLNFWVSGTTTKEIGFFLKGPDGPGQTMYFDEVAFLK